MTIFLQKHISTSFTRSLSLSLSSFIPPRTLHTITITFNGYFKIRCFAWYHLKKKYDNLYFSEEFLTENILMFFFSLNKNETF